MHNGMSWQQQLQQLYAHIGWQSQRIDKLEQTVARLEEELAALKDQKRIHIDKIEYKFDQLKVERLDGTLTIGVTPGTLDAIEDFTVNGNEIGDEQKTPQPPADLDDLVANNIKQYLNREAYEDMKVLEETYSQTLDDSFKQMILEDIQKQIAARIRHYTQQYRGAGLNKPLDAIVKSITDKTKNDIRIAMDMYLSKLTAKESDSS